jgi:acyl carrier protein
MSAVSEIVDVETFVIAATAKRAARGAEIKPASRLDELGLDDVDKTEILLDIEDHFNIDFPHDAMENWVTLDDVIRQASALRNEKP